ncbi:hypothetical protein [Silicimonas sp. MF1-12-2]|uniref:hypothetical protein n=1 Tax=Silicimonas sp. MF1-12-2 TaxID=3384793 RepID=UPI0039B5741A
MKKADQEKAKAAQEKDQASQVDEADSNMEHVLKRLTVERQKQRDKNFGMYR